MSQETENANKKSVTFDNEILAQCSTLFNATTIIVTETEYSYKIEFPFFFFSLRKKNLSRFRTDEAQVQGLPPVIHTRGKGWATRRGKGGGRGREVFFPYFHSYYFYYS